MRAAFLSWAFFFLLAGPAAALASEQDDLKKLLGHSIIGPQVSMTEVQKYTESRVPKMPEVAMAEEWHALADKLRQDVLERVVYRGEGAAWRDAQVRVQWLDTIAGGPGYRIRKLRYEALPGLWIPALLYEPEKLTVRVPAVLNVNGHDGKGKAAAYKQLRCINLAKRGMLALNVEWLNMGQLRGEGFQHYRMNQLDLCGTSGLAPFYLAMRRALDIIMSLEHTDAQRVAVAGLSGGGWQTIFISALDTRVTLANPVAGYSSFLTRARHLSDLGDSEQTPCDLATVADYAHLTAMMAPRATLLTYNIKDNCCFASDHALPPLIEAATPIFKLYEAEQRLRSHVNHDPGTHNFEQDNREAFYRMLGDHFFAGSDGFTTKEIPSESEVKTAEELNVPLPEQNNDFNKLALNLAKELPKDAALPQSKESAERWTADRRQALREVVMADDYQVAPQDAGEETLGEIKAKFFRLRMDDAWTVPAVELTKGNPQGTTLIVADAGRQAVAEQIEKLLSAGQRVVAIDPFYFGESKIAQKDFLFALLVSAVGKRPLGIQASQLAATARWLAEREAGDKQGIKIVALGPRSSLFTLVAAALEEKAIAGIELHESLGSLKQIVEENRSVDKAPELFTFGLLRDHDIRQLAALVAPRKLSFKQPSDRVKQELATLPEYYKLLDGDFTLE